MAMYQSKYFFKLLEFQWERTKAYPIRLIISLSWVIFGFIPQFFFWYIIAQSTNTLPYTTKEIILYFLFSMGLFYNLNQINQYFNTIARGEVVTSVIKPMSLTANYFSIFFSTIFINKLPNLIIITIIGCFIVGITSSILAAIFFLFGLILGCTFFVCFFLLMFWMRNNWGVKWGIDILILFASGTWIPLDILPKFWGGLLLNLPFQLMFYTPAKIFLGQITPTFWLILQYVFWIIILYIIARILEYYGLKYYEQLGG